MALADITRASVLAAIAEYERLTEVAFLQKYGFHRSRSYFLDVDGHRYDSKAIVGAAHGHLGTGASPLAASEFSGGEATVANLLRRLGFEVVNERDGDPAKERNPMWTRDELILALDLYMTNPTSPPGKTSKAVIQLSDVLNRLGAQLARDPAGTYRNPNGVYMKMMNFRRFDPAVRSGGDRRWQGRLAARGQRRRSGLERVRR